MRVRRIMGSPRNWFRRARRKFCRTSDRDVIFLQTNASPPPHEEESTTLTAEEEEEVIPTFQKRVLSLEELAAIKIQACFRGHLARRAFRALRSLVKLQALARGASVRRQARIALHFMHALVRLQVRVRARQLLTTPTEPQS